MSRNKTTYSLMLKMPRIPETPVENLTAKRPCTAAGIRVLIPVTWSIRTEAAQVRGFMVIYLWDSVDMSSQSTLEDPLRSRIGCS
jgi:hypothetical protein